LVLASGGATVKRVKSVMNRDHGREGDLIMGKNWGTKRNKRGGGQVSWGSRIGDGRVGKRRGRSAGIKKIEGRD